MSELTLPGDILGLLRRRSPVFVRQEPFDGWAGTAVVVSGLRALVCMETGCEDAELASTSAHLLALDLTDDTGRTHAARWLGAQRGLAGGMAADVRRTTAGGVVLVVWAARWSFATWTSAEVSALAGLDPDDPRLLPDGSRWVDAEALRLVCLHVAGRNP